MGDRRRAFEVQRSTVAFDLFLSLGACVASMAERVNEWVAVDVGDHRDRGVRDVEGPQLSVDGGTQRVHKCGSKQARLLGRRAERPCWTLLSGTGRRQQREMTRSPRVRISVNSSWLHPSATPRWTHCRG